MAESGLKARWAIGLYGPRICAKVPATQYAVCKELGGAWDTANRWWYWPRNPRTAKTLERGIPFWVERTAGFKELLQTALEQEADLIQAKLGPVQPVPVPATGVPHWKHQERAFWFAVEQPAVMLAMGMGTGKTRVIVDLCQYRQHRLILIVCKLKILSDGVWGRNFEQFYKGGPVHVVELTKGTVAKRQQQAQEAYQMYRSTHTVVIVVNYDAIVFKPLASWLLVQEWDLVVADESHHIKAPGGKRSRLLHTIGKRSKYRAALTGTPLANSPLDAYAQYRFLDTSVFGSSYVLFKNRYAVLGGWENREVRGYKNLEDFVERFQSIAFEVGKEVLDLPPQHHIQRYAELGPVARKHYNELDEDFITWLHGQDEEPVTAANALVKLLRLQQLTGGWLDGVNIDTSKAELLQEILEEIDNHEPVVVFARYLADIKTIHERGELAGRTVYELSGSIDELELWKSSTGGEVLAVQVQAGSEGIELFRAMYCIYYSLGFSLGQYDQSLSRIHRPGQTRTTIYTHLIMKDTKDEQVYKALSEKRAVVEAIMKGEV